MVTQPREGIRGHLLQTRQQQVRQKITIRRSGLVSAQGPPSGTNEIQHLLGATVVHLFQSALQPPALLLQDFPRELRPQQGGGPLESLQPQIDTLNLPRRQRRSALQNFPDLAQTDLALDRQAARKQAPLQEPTQLREAALLQPGQTLGLQRLQPPTRRDRDDGLYQ